MMKQRFLICLLLAAGNLTTVAAQTPKYWIGYSKAVSDFGFFGSGTSNTMHGIKIQSIYYPSDFPTAPSGIVTNLYLRVGAYSLAPAPKIYTNFTVKIGYTVKMQFNTNGATVRDTFVSNLITVFNRPSYTILGVDSAGTWIKIPLQEGNFLYNKTKNFAVEVAQGPPVAPYGINLSANHLDNHAQRTLADTNRNETTSSGSNVSIMDFGFDIAITGVDDVSNITSFGLFPNPATDGRFNVSFDARQAVKETSITVTNVTGQVVLKQQYDNAGSSFFKEIDLHDAAKGVYFVEVRADGERVVRRVVIQ